MNPNLKDFNSIKVRLERSEDVELPFASPFQFHKGTIRTIDVAPVVSVAPTFQFHKGTIRTHLIAQVLLS